MKNEIVIQGVNPLVATSLKQTCSACPSQWEGHLEDGRMFYIRFRWGGLAVSISDHPTSDVGEAVDGGYIFRGQTNDQWNGCMTTDEMKEIVKDVLVFN